jgi:type I restriction enzyme S subunit
LRKGTIDFDRCSFITQHQADGLRIGHAYPGDVLISHKGTIGNVAVVPTDFAMVMLTPQVTLYRPRRDGELDAGYLRSFFESAWYQSRFLALAFQSTRNYLGITQQKKFSIPLPPLPEQRKIADILSTWDAAIEKTESLLSNARTQKRALMQSLLTGKRRFPAFEGQPWKEVRLGEMGQTVSGGTPASETAAYWDGDVHWATPTDITKLSSRFIYQTARMITEDGLKKSSAKLVPEGTILICTRATIGEMAIATAPICTNQGFKNLVLSADFNSDFVFYLLQFFKKELIRYACGSTFLELSKKDFDKRSFMVPSLEEQEQIASVLNDTEDQIDEHRQSITKLRTEKKALMQQLLTGKRRVHV